MTIRLLLGMESGSTTHPPGAILNLNPALEADLVSTNRATWVTPPVLTADAGKPVQAVTSPGGGIGFSAGSALVMPVQERRLDPRQYLAETAATLRLSTASVAVESAITDTPYIVRGTTWYVSNVAANGFALGDDSNTGLSKSAPKLTIAAAHTAAKDGDTIIINSSETIYDSAFYAIQKSLTILPWTYRGVTVRSTSTNTVLRPDVDNVTIGALIIDATITAGGLADGAIRGSFAKKGFKLRGAQLKSGTTYSLYWTGTCDVFDVETISQGANKGQMTFGAAIPGAINVERLKSDGTVNVSASVRDVDFSIVDSDVSVNASGIVRALRGTRARSYRIERCSFAVEGTPTAQTVVITGSTAQATVSVSIKNCSIRNGVASGITTGGYGIGVGGEAAGAGTFDEVLIEDNDVSHCNHGIFTGYGTSKARVRGNVVRDSVIGLIIKGASSGDVVHHHNIVVGGVLDGGALRNKGSANGKFYNNLVVYDAASVAAGVFIYATDSTSAAEYSNNILYAPGLTCSKAVVVDGTSNIAARSNLYNAGTFAANAFGGGTWESWAAVEAGAISADPLFAGVGDYRLSQASPAIGAGVPGMMDRDFVGQPASNTNLGPITTPAI